MNDSVCSHSCKSWSSGPLHHKPNLITPKYCEMIGAQPAWVLTGLFFPATWPNFYITITNIMKDEQNWEDQITFFRWYFADSGSGITLICVQMSWKIGLWTLSTYSPLVECVFTDLQRQGGPAGRLSACSGLGYERGCGGFNKWSDWSFAVYLQLLTTQERSKDVLKDAWSPT